MSLHQLGDQSCNPFLTRLRQSSAINATELAALGSLFTNTRAVSPRAELLAEGQTAAKLHVLLDGWGCCYKILADGGRQITALLLPGDVCDLDRLHLGWINYSVRTLTPCRVSTLDCSAVRTLAARHPGVSSGLGCLSALENANLTERAVGLGRRPAPKRLAHLLCELLVRLSVTGHVHNNSYVLPLTQIDISDVLGLTPIYVNRILQRLRGEGLITLKAQKLVILDWNGLCDLAEFQPNYLQFSIAA